MAGISRAASDAGRGASEVLVVVEALRMKDKRTLPTLLVAIVVLAGVSFVGAAALIGLFAYFYFPSLVGHLAWSTVSDWRFIAVMLASACCIMIIIRKGNWNND